MLYIVIYLFISALLGYLFVLIKSNEIDSIGTFIGAIGLVLIFPFYLAFYMIAIFWHKYQRTKSNRH